MDITYHTGRFTLLHGNLYSKFKHVCKNKKINNTHLRVRIVIFIFQYLCILVHNNNNILLHKEILNTYERPTSELHILKLLQEVINEVI